MFIMFIKLLPIVIIQIELIIRNVKTQNAL